MLCETGSEWGWIAGAIFGTLIAIRIIMVIALTPSLREHEETVGSYGLVSRIDKNRKSVSIVLTLAWLAAWWLAGGLERYCFAATSALAIVAIVLPILLLTFFTAAQQIGSRSVP